MKRESLITNTEKLLFDILQQQKRIEQILIDNVVKLVDKNSCNCSGNCSANEKLLVDRDTTLLAYQVPEKKSTVKTNAKTNAKTKKKG